MTQAEKRIYLIKHLISEHPVYGNVSVPSESVEQRRLLRSLFNVRPPVPIGNDFLTVQNEYLYEEMQRKGVTDYLGLTPLKKDIYLWQGDITTLCCDAIVNAANSQMLGCFCPCHGCIDNAIHTFAGVQLRLECADIMRKQGNEEPTGKAKMTKAYNLPSKFVIHTVGPFVTGKVKTEDEQLLASCYRSCLNLAEKNKIESIAFCCISTGEFHFPNRRSAEIAIDTVNEYKTATGSRIKVIYNVFKNEDYNIYRELLGANQ